MASLAWLLERNHIRRDVPNNAFGMVRNGGSRAHQGWDLYAAPGTPCYAVADGTIAATQTSSSYGNMVFLQFSHRGRQLYAVYCHLSLIISRRGEIRKGDIIGLTGNTGNAKSMQGEDQHLHFEISTTLRSTPGLGNRIDPASLYGRAPIGWTFFEARGKKAIGLGLKVSGVNVSERL